MSIISIEELIEMRKEVSKHCYDAAKVCLYLSLKTIIIFEDDFLKILLLFSTPLFILIKNNYFIFS